MLSPSVSLCFNISDYVACVFCVSVAKIYLIFVMSNFSYENLKTCHWVILFEYPS